MDARCGLPPTIQLRSIPSNMASHTTAEKSGNIQYDNPHMMKRGRACERKLEDGVQIWLELEVEN